MTSVQWGDLGVEVTGVSLPAAPGQAGDPASALGRAQRLLGATFEVELDRPRRRSGPTALTLEAIVWHATLTA